MSALGKLCNVKNWFSHGTDDDEVAATNFDWGTVEDAAAEYASLLADNAAKDEQIDTLAGICKDVQMAAGQPSNVPGVVFVIPPDILFRVAAALKEKS